MAEAEIGTAVGMAVAMVVAITAAERALSSNSRRNPLRSIG